MFAIFHLLKYLLIAYLMSEMTVGTGYLRLIRMGTVPGLAG